MRRPGAAANGWLIDQLLGEPPAALHPVAWFGRAMTRLESHTYRDDRTAGMVHVAIGVGGAWLTGLALRGVVGRAGSTGLATAVSVAGRMLLDEATAAVDAVEAGDLDRARARLPGLVGRDPRHLDEPEVLRAVIESVAENTVDAVVAPLVWAAIGGAPAVLAHRAANTLDAMVGHRDARYEQFGWASARLDDALNWVPARVAAATVIVLVPARAGDIWRSVRNDAARHPSPNGGVIESAFAAALGIRLGGTNRYGDTIEHRGVLGSGPPPTVADARQAIRLARAVGAVVAAGLAIT